MSEYRQNMTNGQWVVVATERAGRPEDFAMPKVHSNREQQGAHSDTCPFCSGGDTETAPKLYEFPNKENWKVRVVANKFAPLNYQKIPERQKVGDFVKATGYGVADVVIEGPEHNRDPALMDPEHVEEVLKAYRARFKELSADPNIGVINVFRNHGPRAGASLQHPHSQIIATNIIPPHISDQVHYARSRFYEEGQCVYCRNMNEEIAQKDRIVAHTDYFVAFCPFASRSPFEVRIMPLAHKASFGDINDAELKDFAKILRTILRKIHFALNDPDYNFIIRSVPVGEEAVPYYHWYMVIIPKLAKMAGMEIGTGIYINTSNPESCAEVLRNTQSW